MHVPKKILAIKLRAMGDTVLMTAPLLELRRAYPNAKIDVVVTREWVSLLENHPAVNKIWPYDRREDTLSRAKVVARMGLALAKEKYDTVVNFHGSPSSALMAFATGAKVRSIHFHDHKAKNMYSTVEIPGKGKLRPIIERDMDAVRALGIEVPEGRLPKIYLKTEELDAAVDLLERHDLIYPTLCLALGASRPTKIWPIEYFARLSTEWVEKTKGSVALLVGPGEEKIIESFQERLKEIAPQHMRSVRALEGLPLRVVAAVLAKSSVCTGNDSGPRHIAVAVGTPTVTMIGPENPFEWHPYPKETHPYLYLENLSCRNDALPNMPPWCGLEICVTEKHRCMRDLTVESVLTESLRVAQL